MITWLILAAAMIVQQAAIQSPSNLSISVAPEIARRYPNGVEVFKVIVTPDGVVSTCAASVEGRGPVTDLANCKKVSRFKARPAVDQNGQKVYGTEEVITSWRIVRSGDSPLPPSAPPHLIPDLLLPLDHLPSGLKSDAISSLVLVVAGDGKVETCLVQKTSGLTALDEAACRAVTETGVTPTKDSAGAAVRAVQSIKVGFSIRP